MNDIAMWVLTRLKEPSTWAGLTGVLAIVNINLDPGLLDNISYWGALIAGAMATGLAERATKKT